ncbi:hypothetical protein DFH09DRAFT_1121800 [Mycena vulgaris]|nr:hypothetical protein DFH09DRAFT_1121800 [Mycena vulgaris]
MFHSTLSHRSPVTTPREKYLAALAEAKAAEAEYLAAERLQQEEDSLRQRLEQIQLLKHQNTPRSLDADFGSYYTPAQYPQPAPLSLGPDLETLRRQIAAEERARIEHEQQQERERKALRKQQAALELQAQRQKEQQARELQALRVHEARKAQAARDSERARGLAAQRAELEYLTHRVSAPAVRFVVSGDSPRKQQCRAHQAPRREFNNTVDFASAPSRPQAQAALDPTDFLQALFGAPQAQKPATKAAPQPKAAPQNISLEQLLSHLGARVEPATEAAPPQPKADADTHQAVSLEGILNHFLGGGAPQPSTSTPAPQPKVQQPAKEAASEAPVSLEQLINHFLGAVGVEQSQPQASTSTAAQQPKAGPSEKKEVTPTPAPAPSAPAPAPQPAAHSSAPPQALGFEHILNQFLGGAGAHSSAPAQVDVQQLMNMFMGGHPCAQAPKAPEASSSKSASTESAMKQELEARLRSQQSSEERDLAEAIRMSLAESTAAPASPSDSKGKAPAPAPVKDVATSTAEVKAIDASFHSLSSEFVFPAQLDFSTSRTASPNRVTGTTEPESAVARLSYSAHNQPVRFYQQALSRLLAQLDEVESFGDDGLRHARKEVVGRVEGALDELERVIEARWRKFAGKEERKEVVSEPVSVPVESAPEAVEEAPVVVTAEEFPAIELEPAVVESVESAAEPVLDTPTPAVAAPSPAAESSSSPAAESSYPPAAESSSYPPVAESSYPPAAESITTSESVETIRPYDSPATPSDIDTILLPAASDEPAPKKAKASEEDVGSDWSEVDA